MDPRAVSYDDSTSTLQYYNGTGAVSIPYTGPAGPTGPIGPTGPSGPSGGSTYLLDAKTTYSCVGDGITDDTVALQAVLNSGTWVYLPSGVYMCSNLPSLTDGTVVWGPGIIKRMNTSGLSATEHYIIDATGADNWGMHGITFDGNLSGQSGSAGFKVSGILIGQSTNFTITECNFINHHENCIEIASSTQGNPIDYKNPPALAAGTIYRGGIHNCLFKDSGRNVDDGAGYSNSSAIQLGSTTQSIILSGNRFWNCLGGISGGAYNSNSIINGNTIWLDSSAYAYGGVGIALTQLSKDCIVANNVIIGYHEGLDIESVIGGTVANNRLRDVVNGINIFASNIGSTALDLSKLSVTGNSVECRSNTAGSFGIRAVLASQHGAYDIAISGNQVNGGDNSIFLSGITGAIVNGNTARGGNIGIVSNGCTDVNISSNQVTGCVNQGVYLGASNNRVVVRGNDACGNGYGVYVDTSQTDVTVAGNTMLNNSTKDFFINGSTNVRHYNNDTLTQSGTVSTISGVTPSLQFVGDVIYTGNTTTTVMTGFSNGTPGRTYRVIGNDAHTTIQNGGTGHIYLKTTGNRTLSTNIGILLLCDVNGVAFYEV